MPNIFDNIDHHLLTGLRSTLEVSNRADFCVGYLNLRGWRMIDKYPEAWAGNEESRGRLLVGMQQLPRQELQEALSLLESRTGIDNQTANQLRKRLAQEFRDQLCIGAPSNQDEAGLRRLKSQLRAGKVVVKLFLQYRLHAKLYLCFRDDVVSPIVGYLGSSNLTMAGLSSQGELNIDVVDQDACQKLADWFNARWEDRWCVDISNEIEEIIEESWAREELIPPYAIYLKMAYHLSREARMGLAEFRIPRDFGDKLFDFQVAAVKIAAHHLNKRGGVLIGDVVGLGKTLMATALARIFEDDYDLETLIICPKNLVEMWEDYRQRYRLRAKVLSISRVLTQLPDLRRYRLVLIDESHNLRNREGKRYRAIQEYLQENESKVILLTATPYNKTYLDLSNQLRLFTPEDQEIGIRPEKLLRELGETDFIRKHQCAVRSLAAFEKSEYADDWRDLMRLYLVRRTRSFIKNNYAETDSESGRKFLRFEDGTLSHFPDRVAKTLKFKIDDKDSEDQYARLYGDSVVDTVQGLHLPRYGLGNYVKPSPDEPPTQSEARALADLSRAGKRLMGFCRTNLFKRLESSGEAFLLSVQRHILRNLIYLHAIEENLSLPVGTQDAELLDARIQDEDVDSATPFLSLFEDDSEDSEDDGEGVGSQVRDLDRWKSEAEKIYRIYWEAKKGRFRWLRPDLFDVELLTHLKEDVEALLQVLVDGGKWEPARDSKLKELYRTLSQVHASEKVIVFSQFADTVRYLARELKLLGIEQLEAVTGQSASPTHLAWRLSPVSNEKRDQVTAEDELRILIATDVLSEGQNLQDAAIVVNYDLPWAIIRLIQRAGRVDRIGQKAEKILCYTFMPADGVERIIRLRARVRRRLQENAEVVGTDEAFFEDDRNDQAIRDLFTEKAGILDDEDDADVDLASFAYQIWKNAIDADPAVERLVEELPSVVYSTRLHLPSEEQPEGALVFARTSQGTDALAWINDAGESVTESQLAILKAAECAPDIPALSRHENHHSLVRKGVRVIAKEEQMIGGQLGRPSGARFRTYERLKRYAEDVSGSLFDIPELRRVIEDIYRFPLRQTATDTLNRQLRSGISDEVLAELAISLREEGRLCIVHEDEKAREPAIICSLGLRSK